MATTSNYKSHEKKINREFTDFMYGEYMKNYWMIEVGYSLEPKSVVEKTLLDWQLLTDCNGELTTLSKNSGIIPTQEMSLANFNANSIYIPLCAHAKNQYSNCHGDCNIYMGNCGCGYIYQNCCANAPYNLAYNYPFVIWN